MYYAGSNSLNLPQTTKFVGSTFVKQANSRMYENASITGDIISGGNKVEIFINTTLNHSMDYLCTKC